MSGVAGVVLLSIDEAAALLSLSWVEVRRLAKARKLPWYDVGGMKFSLADVRAYDRSQPIPKAEPRKRIKRGGISAKVRFRVLERDGFRCRYCGASAGEERLVLDHVLPVADGGTDDEDNLVAACDPCNLGKGSRPLSATLPSSAASRFYPSSSRLAA